jgi:N-acetyl sugar amidotransferase
MGDNLDIEMETRMKYCKRCVQTDTRPGIGFNSDGICGACEYELNEFPYIDWEIRKSELLEAAAWAKSTTKSAYDCVIGVSGGKDSLFQAVYSRDTLGLRPLLVNSEPEGITNIGSNNIENLKSLGFDVISIRPNPVVMKQLVRKSFYEYGNPAKITEYSLTASAYIVADKFGIPLIIQGENDAYVYGVKEFDADGNALNMNKLNTQLTPLEDFVEPGVNIQDLFLFRYDRERMSDNGFKGVWLQYYYREWSGIHNVKFSMRRGLQIRPRNFNPYDYGTYSAYWQLDCDIWPLNNLLKYLKFGFGQCTDHARFDIAANLISRQEAIELVRLYDGKCSRAFIQDFCKYIDISYSEFWRVANSYRGKMWGQVDDKEWRLVDPIWEQEPLNENIDTAAIIQRVYPVVE